MNPVLLAFRDRRMGLFLLVGLLAFLLGFVSFTPQQGFQAIIHGGYWMTMIMVVLFGWALFKLFRREFSQEATWRSFLQWPSWLIVGCSILLLVHERYAFKILMDEASLLGTSMSMHFQRTVMLPMRGHDLYGTFQIVAGDLDKRPMLQPFLTSILHDFTGYRPENVFILNSILTFVLLTLAYLVGRKLVGRAGGALVVLLLTSLPLLAQNATGGGFEILNLVMILATLLLGIRYAERRDADSQEALIFSTVLLAQTRYESVLFVFPVALLIGWAWWRERRPVLSLPFCFAPLLFIPYALHNKVFGERQTSWEMLGEFQSAPPFSLGYIPKNIAHALNFFFDATGEQPNSLVLAGLGFIAVPFVALWAAKVLRQVRTEKPERVTFAIFLLGFGAHTLLLLAFFWGRFDDPVVQRLSLPLNLVLALTIVVVVAEFRRPGIFRAICGATVAVMFSHSLPAMARHDFTSNYFYGREAEWRREFIAQHPERNYLFIDAASNLWIAHLVSATPILQANLHKENIEFHLRNHSFDSIYVFQSFDVDPETGALTVNRDDALSSDYELVKVEERRFSLLRMSRISRVVGIKTGQTTPPLPAPPAKKLSPEEKKAAEQQYFNQFLQRLP